MPDALTVATDAYEAGGIAGVLTALGIPANLSADEVRERMRGNHERARLIGELARDAGWWKGAAEFMTRCLRECSDDLEALVLAQKDIKRRQDRDLEPVVEARRLIGIIEAKLKETDK